MTRHIAAIHTLKAKVQMSDDAYRVLLARLTGKASSKDMSVAERAIVRDHLAALAARLGVAPSAPARRHEAPPKERKVWALWQQLARDGKIARADAAALNAWVKRQVGVDALRFATAAQLDTLIESLKEWRQR